MRNAGLPIALLSLGVVWLLDSLHWLPDIQWVWVIGLIGAGVAILLLDGLTKSSIFSGPMLITMGVLAYFRQFHYLGWRYIIPVVLIVGGVTLLLARSSSVPASRAERRERKARANRPDHPGSGT